MDIVEATRVFDFIAALMRYDQDYDAGLTLRNDFERNPIQTMRDKQVGDDGAVMLYRCAVSGPDDPTPNPQRSSMQDAIDSVVLGPWPGPVTPVDPPPAVFYDNDLWHMLLFLVADHVAGRVTTSYIQSHAQEIVTRYRLSQERWLAFRDGPRTTVAQRLLNEFSAWDPKDKIWHTNGGYPAGCEDTDDGKFLAVLWADPRAEIRRIRPQWASKANGTVSVDIYGQGIFETAGFYLEDAKGKRYAFNDDLKILPGSTFRCTHITVSITLADVSTGTDVPTGSYSVNATYGDPLYDPADFNTHAKFFVED
jgi:hypothetical protein